ncbi:MAG: HDOD domain-containing protein [Nitrosomonas sp.]|uniref:HDOD domain-containing protein n=1 Tax=Nitrosomonas sp. TaxID=42353 RepID=UPI002733498F|nr:HDOD domain-containing protein [Nitrosomonas sp.]MDP3280902.1 HDOD domain-containing protein [Nitrosomonas sp.]MDP3661987.1 HDOD domain-containing protein [Nitrosomonas sp.]MDZ4106416.1 HDOD domain-containing protein [Nitrosomonas sp.]
MEKRVLLSALADEVERGKLFFPTSATATLQIKKMLEDTDCDFDAVTRLIQADPLLSVKIVAVANSVVFNRSGKKITSVSAAVTLLGLRTVRNLAMAVITQQLAGTQSKSELVAQLWQHSAHVAALAQVIARRISHQDPDTAMFAGIIHEISWFYLLSREKAYPGLIDGNIANSWVSDDDLDEEDELACEMKISTAILQALSVPEPIADAIAHLWQGSLIFPPATLGDTLLLADQLAPVKSPFAPAQTQARDDFLTKLDRLANQQALDAILAESEEEVKSLTAALCA